MCGKMKGPHKINQNGIEMSGCAVILFKQKIGKL